MGMFNNIDWRMPLPDGLDPAKACGHLGFQTKVLGENNMDRYIVSPVGRLYKYEYKTHYTGRWYDYDEKMKQIYWDEKPAYTKGTQIVGGIKLTLGPYQETERIKERYTFVPFTGSFNFYGGEGKEWNEYVATFEEGELVTVVRDDERHRRLMNALRNL